MARHPYELTTDRDFDQVITHCAHVPRSGQDGSWLGADMISAYRALHAVGHAHSAEAYRDGRLVGGLYGVTVGNVFFGESMFSLEQGVSKVVFATLAPQLFELGYEMIDCQMHTAHLERFGAQSMCADEFYHRLSSMTQVRPPKIWP